MYKIVIRFFLALSAVMLTLPGMVYGAPTMRIVSSGGSITEIIYALDKQDFIVASDSTSLYPAAAAALPKLGYFRQLSVEGVLSFQPTHLIGAHATGPKELATQLTAAGVKVHILGEQRDLQGLHQLIQQVGKLLDAEDKALLLIDNIDQQVNKLKRQAQDLAPITALFVMSNSERGLTVTGGNTVPQALFNDAGIQNAAVDMSDYKVMDNESILVANPALIFVASHNVHSEQARLALCQHPALKATKAGKNCAVIAMESSSALGLSPRYPQALQQMISSSTAVQAHAD